jgi:hypothetical protein
MRGREEGRRDGGRRREGKKGEESSREKVFVIWMEKRKKQEKRAKLSYLSKIIKSGTGAIVLPNAWTRVGISGPGA